MTAIETSYNTPQLFIEKLDNNTKEKLEIKYSDPKKYLPLKSYNEKDSSFVVRSDSNNTLCDEDLKIKKQSKITWSVTSEQGYRRKLNDRTPLHSEIEDMHWPHRLENSFTHNHPINGNPIHIYILADGHGGHEAPKIFMARSCAACFKVMEDKDWNLSNEEQRNKLKEELTDTIIKLDKQFCDEKIEQYKEYNKNGGTKPVDDGCTLVVNILYDGYLVNVNTGDSRTVLGSKKNKSYFLHKKSGFQTEFSSLDQSPDHPEKAYNVAHNGGIFLNSGGIPRRRPNIEPFEQRGMKTYPELVGTRIYRPSNPTIAELGINHLMTLNMGGSMGDLLFKIEPAVISCRPDVSIIKLDQSVDNILLIATDGIWDHLIWQDSDKQNEKIMNYINKEITSATGNSSDVEISEELLKKITEKLVKREFNLELYEPRQRYDDCTAFLVYLPAGTEEENMNASR